MKNYKKFSIFFIFTISFIFLFVIIFNFLIDPFQQFRKTKFYVFGEKDQRYLNAGLLKNYDYDSVLIGSSLVGNFDVNSISKYLNFNKTLKVPTFGGVISEEVKTLDFAIKNKKINNVLFGLDTYSFSNFNLPVEKLDRFPNFLYDNKISNDFDYIFNFRTFRYAFRYIFHPYSEEKIKSRLNSLYDWQEEFKLSFNKKSAIAHFCIDSKKASISYGKIFDISILKKNFDEYLLPIVSKNRNINFYFFFPPYSILNFKLMEKSDYLDDHISFKNYIYNKLKKFKNVKLYDFQEIKEITHDLNNYKDINHYHKKVNIIMLKSMQQDKYLIDNNFYLNMSKILKKQVINYKVDENVCK